MAKTSPELFASTFSPMEHGLGNPPVPVHVACISSRMKLPGAVVPTTAKKFPTTIPSQTLGKSAEAAGALSLVVSSGGITAKLSESNAIPQMPDSKARDMALDRLASPAWTFPADTNKSRPRRLENKPVVRIGPQAKYKLNPTH
jgi:hypothetical protein